MKIARKPRAILSWLIRIAALSALGMLVLIAWYVTGPATKAPSASLDGVPADAWPRMTAETISDVPMSCSFVARDNELLAKTARPHRNHTYLVKHGGLYFVMFSYWFGAEGQPGQAVQYATSKDGVAWSEPQKLADPAPDHGIIARGFVERDGKLFAWYATHTGDTFFRNNKKKIERNIAILESEWLGPEEGWRFNRVVVEDMLNNYAPRRFGDRLAMGLRDSDRETYLATSEDNGQSWQISEKMPLPQIPRRGTPGLYLPDEPIVASVSNGNARMLLRNNNWADGRMWAADYKGGAWSDPFPLGFASDTSKFFPLELSDGAVALIGNFEPEVHRALLHIAVSDDKGREYGHLYRLSLDGQYGRMRWRSPQYPHAIVDGDTLLLGVSYGKRAISVCKGPANSAAIEKSAGFALLPRLADGMCNKDLPALLRRLFGYMGCNEHFVWG